MSAPTRPILRWHGGKWLLTTWRALSMVVGASLAKGSTKCAANQDANVRQQRGASASCTTNAGGGETAIKSIHGESRLRKGSGRMLRKPMAAGYGGVICQSAMADSQPAPVRMAPGVLCPRTGCHTRCTLVTSRPGWKLTIFAATVPASILTTYKPYRQERTSCGGRVSSLGMPGRRIARRGILTTMKTPFAARMGHGPVERAAEKGSSNGQ